MTITPEMLADITNEVWPAELIAKEIDHRVEQLLDKAARDLTSMAVLDWNWPTRDV